jgi:hypothetical protein
LAGCGESGTDQAQNTAGGRTSSSPPEAPKLSQEEREKLVASATKGFKLDRDKMESISFYTIKSPVVLTPEVNSYLSIPDKARPFFRINLSYIGKGWVFFDQVKIMADDRVVYEKKFSRSQTSRNVLTSLVTETADYPASNADIVAFNEIANAKSVTIRFSGSDRREDHVLTKGEIGRLKSTLAAYATLEPLLKQ